MTSYQASDEKTVQILSLYPVQIFSLYPVCSLHFVPNRHFLPGLQSTRCIDQIGIAVFARASFKSGPKYWGSKRNFNETILAAMIDVWTVY